MNKHISETDLAAPKVTTGPLSGSRKIYARPETRARAARAAARDSADRGRQGAAGAWSTIPPAPTRIPM